MAAATTTTPAPVPTSLEVDARAVRINRRAEILARLQSSGEFTDPVVMTETMDAIETYEYAGGDRALSAQRKMVTSSLLPMGHCKMVDVVKTAEAQIAALSNFTMAPVPTTTQ